MNIYKTVFNTEAQGEVYPGDASAHQFYGFPRNAELIAVR